MAIPVKTTHKTSYPSISPLRPELSTKGKNALITGGGSGIGASIARSFAKSGITNLALLGRTEKTLLENKAYIEENYPETKVWTYAVNIVDAESTNSVLEAYTTAINGKIDILIANAGYMPKTQPITVADPVDWWLTFEINVKGNFNLLRAFHPLATPEATVIHISTSAMYTEFMDGFSAYRGSKLGSYKVFEWYANENPEKVVIQFHPGLIMDTAITRPIVDVVKQYGLVPEDVSLPSDFAVWAASDEAKFLNRKFVECMWDVDELKAAKDEFKESWEKLTVGLVV
ncbi:peroxisomal short-chain alcohol dehydrogenase [Fusarium beomiforme]|uniref:Peroxisomal short-chain alcohol dehydrogenase n=1 Tax=Fusarium beomiforme TaxID=44412 RepID=A0A9P5ACS6_9HYPO|nr:peroxisomal short-chain alcohol dehydrogenase [Fusarium beomiforme]